MRRLGRRLGLPAGGPTVTSGSAGRYAGFRPYVDARHRSYDTAVERMVTEAQAMGADGVVGVVGAAVTVSREEGRSRRPQVWSDGT